MSYLHVAVAAIVNDDDEVLVALRPDHVHQGGLWEFPGGKVEQNENIVDALKREIHEELDIKITAMSPLIQVTHDYPDKSVLLDVWRVEGFQGTAKSMEGQPIRWQKISDLQVHMFPAANRSIIQALQLPDQYMITGNFKDLDDFRFRLNQALLNGKKIVQLRARHLTNTRHYMQLANIARDICLSHHALLLLNTSAALFDDSLANGLHLGSQALLTHNERPVAEDVLLSVSCHNETEIRQAKLLNADIVLLSPVKETSSHPGVPGIGWAEFRRLAQLVSCPVYALGGMDLADLDDAKVSGAQGIAAISALWPNE